jgi:hypothetical protein
MVVGNRVVRTRDGDVSPYAGKLGRAGNRQAAARVAQHARLAKEMKANSTPQNDSEEKEVGVGVGVVWCGAVQVQGPAEV